LFSDYVRCRCLLDYDGNSGYDSNSIVGYINSKDYEDKDKGFVEICEDDNMFSYFNKVYDVIVEVVL